MQKLKLATLSALALTTLAACGPSGSDPSLANIPSDIPACFRKLVPKPEGEVMTQADMIKLVSDLKTSELSKSLCGQRLITFYNTQKNVFEKRK
jgi:hypothetical protein